MRERTRALVVPLRYGAFRRLWLSALLSEVGDWAARLALVVLVYGRTGSTVLTGLVTAVSLAAWLGPGQLLAGLADRTSRRTVLVTADLVRAVAFGVAALGVSLPVLLLLVFLAGLATPPAQAAAAAARPSLVPAQVLPAAHTVLGLSGDVALLGGTLAGGSLVALVGATGALWLDALTFVGSAALVVGLPAGRPAEAAGGPRWRLAVAALRDTPAVRRAALLACTAMGSASAAAAMLTPYVLGVLHRGPGRVALLSAGSVVVTLVVTALAVPHRPCVGTQLRAVAALTTTGGLALLVLAGSPGTPLLLVALVGLGVLQVAIVPASALVGPLLPDAVRAGAFSLLMGGLALAQAAAAAGAGLLAVAVGPGPAVAAAALPSVLLGGYALVRPLGSTAGEEPVTTPALASAATPSAATPSAVPPALAAAVVRVLVTP